MTEQPPEQISGHERNQAEFLREEFERNGRLGRDDIRWLLDIAEGKSEQPPEVPQRKIERTDYNEPLELAKQRVAIVERVMKLPYIKATRDTERGQERFVARDDLIAAIHDYVKLPQREEAPNPPVSRGAMCVCGHERIYHEYLNHRCHTCSNCECQEFAQQQPEGK